MINIALGAALSGLWLWVMGRKHWSAPVLLGVCIAATVLANPGMWLAMSTGYAGDSFWTLDSVGRLGVAAISVAGLVAFFAVSARLAMLKGGGIGLALVVGLASLMLFVVMFSVAPQAFYAFYRTRIPSLPDQNVMPSVLDTDRLHAITALNADGTLAVHIAGIAFIAALPFVLLLRARGAETALPFLVLSWLWLVTTALI